jgi:hypothetical protein
MWNGTTIMRGAVREIYGQKYDFRFKLMWSSCVLTEVGGDVNELSVSYIDE